MPAMTLQEYAAAHPGDGGTPGFRSYLETEAARAADGGRCRMVPTTDEWYPAFDGGFVRLSLVPLRDGTWRCCVWGGDDFGLDFDTPDRAAATAMYDLVAAMPNVVVADLKRRGFLNA